jgi:hypothetical protein
MIKKLEVSDLEGVAKEFYSKLFSKYPEPEQIFLMRYDVILWQWNTGSADVATQWFTVKLDRFNRFKYSWRFAKYDSLPDYWNLYDDDEADIDNAKLSSECEMESGEGETCNLTIMIRIANERLSHMYE